MKNMLALSQERFSARKFTSEAATERGLGTCWVCNYNPDKMKQLFSRPGFEAVVIIPIGHIAEDCPHAEKKRKDMSEIVEEI